MEFDKSGNILKYFVIIIDSMYSLKCSDAGFDCDYEIKGNNEEEIMDNVKEHGKNDHKLQDNDFTPIMIGNIRKLIKKTD